MQDASGQKPQAELKQQVFIGQDIAKQDPEAETVARLSFQVVKSGRGVEQQCDTRASSVAPAVEPLL